MPDSLRNAVPCAGTVTVYDPVAVPTSARARRSRMATVPVRPALAKVTVIGAAESPRLSSTTARCPLPESVLLYTSPVLLLATRTPWTSSRSWSTPMISGLSSVSIMAWGRVRGSEPTISGAAISAHITSCVVDSSWLSS